MVTGEPMPVEKAAGDTVIGGTINGTGALRHARGAVGADTLLARIVQMVAEAQRSRAPIQRLADAVAGWFVPAVIAGRVVAFVVWAAVGPGAALRLRARRRGRGAHHRLPLRARPGDADVDHGRRRHAAPRRASSSGTPRRWNAREGRHAGGRQDRHADRRQPRVTAIVAGRRLRRSRGAARSPRAWSARSEHPLAAAIVAAAARRGLALAGRRRFRSRHRQGRDRHGRRPPRSLSATPLLHTRLGIAGAARGAAPRRCARDGATACSSPSTAAGRRHRGRRPDQGDDAGGARERCAPTACASSC